MMITQLNDIGPSAKAPLFRRLMSDDNLAYLRDGKKIVGFELNLKVDQKLSGFSLVGIQKHTIYAYRSDLHEEPRLVLFPPLDKLFDSTFKMLDLDVIKTEFSDTSFNGRVLAKGRLEELVRDLTPPEKDIDIPDGVSEQMVERMRNIQMHAQPIEKTVVQTAEPVVEPERDEAPVVSDTAMEHDMLNNFEDVGYDSFEEGYDSYDSYEEFSDDDTFEPVPAPVAEPVIEEAPSDERTIQLKAQSFDNLVDVGDYVHRTFNIPRSITTQVVNRALQSNVVVEGRVQLAVMLFSKLFDEKKL